MQSVAGGLYRRTRWLDGEAVAHGCAGEYLSSVYSGERLDESSSERGQAALKVKVRNQIFLSSPDVTQAEEDALIRVIRSGWVAPVGPELDAFEHELAAYSGRRHAVALSSGTAALHLALITLGVGPGDKVLTPTMTFAATANSIVYTGAEPVFVDADETGNMSPDLLEEAFVTLAGEGQRVKAVLPVDMLGKVADHARIGSIAGRYGVPVVSDAAESFGAIRDGRQSGSFGIAAAVSFNGNKIMTTSGGGALLTDCADHANHVRYLATQARQPGPHYQHTEIGYNYRLSNVLAALGRAQLSRLDSMIDQRRQHRLHYRALFAGVPGVTLFGEPSGADVGPPRDNFWPTRDNFWLTSILIDPHRAGFSADELRLYLAGAGIEARPMWKPMHLQPVHADARSFIDGTSERLFCTGLSLPSGSVLNQDQIARVGYVINGFLEGARVAACATALREAEAISGRLDQRRRLVVYLAPPTGHGSLSSSPAWSPGSLSSSTARP